MWTLAAAVLTLGALGGLGFAVLTRLERAIPWVLGLIVVLPSTSIAGLGFRAEHLLAPVLVLAVLIRLGRGGPPASGGLVLLVAASWLTLGLAAAVGSPVTSGNVWMGAYTVARPLLWLSLGLLAWRASIVPQLVRAWLVASIAAGGIALAQAANVAVVRAVTDVWYSSAGRAAGELIAEAELRGFFARPMGPFENVSYAATAELLALASAVWWLNSGPRHGRDRLLGQVALLVAIAAGLATVSATFIAGAPLVAVLALVLSERRPSWRWVVGATMAGTGVVLLLVWLLDVVWGGGASFAAQVDRVRTITLFANRYSQGEGVMADAIAAIAVRPWFGWGLLAGGDTFFSDSLYVFAAYTTGVVGSVLLAVLLVVPWAVARHVSSPGARFALLWAGVLLLAGLGAPSVFIPRVMEWWWAIAGIMVGLRREVDGGLEGSRGRPLPFGMLPTDRSPAQLA